MRVRGDTECGASASGGVRGGESEEMGGRLDGSRILRGGGEIFEKRGGGGSGGRVRSKLRMYLESR